MALRNNYLPAFLIAAALWLIPASGKSQTVSEITNILNTKPQSVTTANAAVTNDDIIAALDLTTYGYRAITITLKGTWAGIVSFQGSNDNFTTTDAIPAFDVTNATSATATTATANGTYLFSCVGWRYIRVRLTTATSGTVNSVAFGYLNNIYSNNRLVSAVQSGTWNIGSITTLPALTTGSAQIGHLEANQSTNIAQINGVTPQMGNGVTGTGSQRVTIASDNTAFSVNATLQAGTAQIGHLEANQSTNIAQMNGVTVSMGSGIMGTGVQRVAIASDNDALTVKQATGTNLHVVLDNTSALAANQSVNVAQMNGVAVSMGSGTNGTGVQRVSLATDQAALTTAGLFSVKIDQTTVGTTNAISLAQIGATTVVNGGTAGSLSVGGMVANNGTINSAVNPILIGGQAVSSENAANTTAKLSQFVTDLVGKLIVLPYANPENMVSGAITTAMTGTTSTSLIAAPAAGLRNYITTIIVSNAHATVGTDIIIQDGSGGTTLMTIPAAAVYGGAVINLPVPLRQPTTATAIYCANVTTGASTKVSAVGYIGK